MSKKSKNNSVYLSYLLRHHPEEAGCKMDSQGYVDIDTLCKNTGFTLQILEQLVENNTRFGFNDDKTKIRAFHGHSVKGIIYETTDNIPDELYHGTSIENYEKIMNSGYIKSQSRDKVHLSSTIEKAFDIGSRHGKPVVLVIDSKLLVEHKYKISHSVDNVYLTSDIPVKYIKCIIAK